MPTKPELLAKLESLMPKGSKQQDKAAALLAARLKMVNHLGELRRQALGARAETDEAWKDTFTHPEDYLVALGNLVTICDLEVGKQIEYIKQVDQEIALSVALGCVVRAADYEEPKGKWGYYLRLMIDHRPVHFQNIELLTAHLTSLDLYYNSDTCIVTNEAGERVGHITREEE